MTSHREEGREVELFAVLHLDEIGAHLTLDLATPVELAEAPLHHLGNALIKVKASNARSHYKVITNVCYVVKLSVQTQKCL
jgi:hypothetical protein